jgi:hypothetical protein
VLIPVGDLVVHGLHNAIQPFRPPRLPETSPKASTEPPFARWLLEG